MMNVIMIMIMSFELRKNILLFKVINKKKKRLFMKYHLKGWHFLSLNYILIF